MGQTRLGWQERQADTSAMSLKTSIDRRQGEIFTALMAAQKRRGERATKICQTRATILARREFGESLVDIAKDLNMPYETVKTYAKLARRILRN